VFNLGTGEQYGDSTLAAAYAWPVRSPYKLVDNGDGTVTDTARRLMWLRDTTALGLRDRAQAEQAAASLLFAGHGDWRLPAMTDVERDPTCVSEEMFMSITTTPTGGCARSELGHLYQGWGIRSQSSAPFANLPLGGGPFWMSGDRGTTMGVTFTFFGGGQRLAPTTSLAMAWAVRDLAPGDLPRGSAVIVEPHPSVIVRFRQVNTAGVIGVRVRRPTVDPFQPRPYYYGLSTGASFDGSAGGVEVCLRYASSEVAAGTVYVAQVVKEATTGLPLVAGYPDTVNKVACGKTSSLAGEFKVVSAQGKPIWP
jgi:hypothetical protein